MKLNNGDHAQCPCCKKCTDCTAGFQKLVDLKDVGLVIYRQTTQTEDVNKYTKIIELSTKTSEDVFILHNTKDIDLSPSDCLREIDQNSINCPRCRKIIDHAQKLLQKVPTINKNDVKGICEHCRAKESSCIECKNVVKKFVARKTERSEVTKIRMIQWLSRIKHLLKNVADTNKDTDSIRAHSEMNINQLCRDISKQTDTKQVFYPKTNWADFAKEFPIIDKRRKISPHLQIIESDAFADVSSRKFVEPCTSRSKDGIKRQYTDQYGPCLDKMYIKDLQSVNLASLVDLEKEKEGKHVQLRDVILMPNQSEKLLNLGSDESIVFTQSFHAIPETEANRKTLDGTTVEEKYDRRLISAKVHNRGRSSQLQERSTLLPFLRALKNRHYAIDENSGKSFIHDEELFHRDAKNSKNHEVIAGESLKKLTEPIFFLRKYHSEESLLNTHEEKTSEIINQGFDYVFPTNNPLGSDKQNIQTSSAELINDIQVKILQEKAKNKELEEEKRKFKFDQDEKRRIFQEEKRRKQEMNNIKSENENEQQKHENNLSKLKKKDVIEKVKKVNSSATSKASTFKGKISIDTPKELKNTVTKLAEKSKEPKLNEQKLSKAPREPKQIKEPLELKRSNEQKQPKETKQIKEPQNLRQIKEDTVEIKRPKLTKEPKSIKEFKQLVTPNDAKKRINITASKSPKQRIDTSTHTSPKNVNNQKIPEDLKEPTAFNKIKGQKQSHSLEKWKIEEPKEISRILEDPKNLIGTRDAHETKKPKTIKEIKELKRSNDPGKLTNKKKEFDLKIDTVRLSKIKLKKLSEIDFDPALTNTKSTKQEKKDTINKADRENKNMQKFKDVEKKEDKSKIAIKNEIIKQNNGDNNLKSEKTLDANEPGVCHYKELNIDKITLRRTSSFIDDYILRLVRTTRSAGKLVGNQNQFDEDELNALRRTKSLVSIGSYEELLKRNIDRKRDIVIGQKIYTYTPSLRKRQTSGDFKLPYLVKSISDVNIRAENIPNTKGMQPKLADKNHEKLNKETKKQQPSEPAKGVIRYALSDRTFIEKGWTMLPTEKVVRKMNVYRMYPAQPQFDWFERNKIRQQMKYETGEKLAEFEESGRGRWFYKNGRMALDYYDAEELNAQQRFVIYSNGEPDERGRARPYTLLATFDYLGNAIVLDHSGKIRLKYNQTEGVLLDRSIGPVTHWKWHTLNDPPVLQQVMIDTQMTLKDPTIAKLGTPNEKKQRPDNEDMLAIEFDNFIKEKSKKLTQTFKPFQIRMKALKINEHFSLKILDQATVYLIFRDGTTNLKLNVGMLLNHKEIVDTDTADLGDVANNLERFPARTESLALLQKSIAHAQYYERTRTEREQKLRPPQPCESADNLIAGVSKRLRTPLFIAPSASTTTANGCRCSRKPTASNVYYDARLN